MIERRTERAFIENVVGTEILERAIEFIRDYLRPEDVFDREALKQWAEENDYGCEEKW